MSRIPIAPNQLVVGSVWSTSLTTEDSQDGYNIVPVPIHHILHGAVTKQQVEAYGVDKAFVKRSNAGLHFCLGCRIDGRSGIKESVCCFIVHCSYSEKNVLSIRRLNLTHNDSCSVAEGAVGSQLGRQRIANGRYVFIT